MANENLEAIEQELRRLVDESTLPLKGTPAYSDLLNILSYHLGWTDREGNRAAVYPGKRLRPLLCLLSCEAAGGNAALALPAAAAIELVHNFSLIHDDIEDNSDERRGRPAVWKVWGLAQGINAGDALFALAQLAFDRLSERVDAETRISVRAQFDSACLALTQGQYLDLLFESRANVTAVDYIEMVRGKSAALVAASTGIGARIAGPDPARVEALTRFGENLGIAFQIIDDVLGIWGDPNATGKPAASDISARKKTLPLLLAVEADGEGEIGAFLAKAQITDDDVARTLALLDRLQVRGLVEERAESFLARALDALQASKVDNPAADSLRELARAAVYRIR